MSELRNKSTFYGLYTDFCQRSQGRASSKDAPLNQGGPSSQDPFEHLGSEYPNLSDGDASSDNESRHAQGSNEDPDSLEDEDQDAETYHALLEGLDFG